MSPRKGQKVGGRRATPSALRPGAESAVLTLQDVADYLNCSYTTAFRLARQGIIPGFRLRAEGDWRVLKSEVDEWIAKGGGKVAGSAPAKTDGGRHGRKPKPKATKS
jgi:excisionase family DNA binding protein